MKVCWNAEQAALKELNLKAQIKGELPKVGLKADGDFKNSSRTTLDKIRGALSPDEVEVVREAIKCCYNDATVARADVDKYLADFDAVAGQNDSLTGEGNTSVIIADKIKESFQTIVVIPNADDSKSSDSLTMQRDLFVRSNNGWFERRFRDENGFLMDIDELIYKTHGIVAESAKNQAIYRMQMEATKVERKNTFHESEVPLGNGVFSLKTGELLSWKNEAGDEWVDRGVYIYGLPRNYIPNAKMPENIADMLSKTFGKRVKLIRQLLAFVGMSATTSKRSQKAFIGIGEKASNGKSTLNNLLRQCFGGTYCRVKLQNLTENRFAGADLDGSLIAVDDDTNTQNIENNGTFNELVTSRYLSVEAKHVQARIIPNLLTLWVFTNAIPRIGNAETFSGVIRRMQIVPFESEFSLKIKEDDWKRRRFKADLTLENKVYSEEELDAFFSICLQYYRKEWLEPGSILLDLDESQAKFEQDYREKVDTIALYINKTNLQPKELNGVPVEDVVYKIREFLKKEGVQHIPQGVTVQKRLQQSFPGLSQERNEKDNNLYFKYERSTNND